MAGAWQGASHFAKGNSSLKKGTSQDTDLGRAGPSSAHAAQQRHAGTAGHTEMGSTALEMQWVRPVV